MKITIGIFCVSLICGCTLIPTDMFPKATWYWSADAKAHRANVAAEKQWEKSQSTNTITQ